MSYDSDNATNEDIYLSDQYPIFEDYPVSDDEQEDSSWEDLDLSEDSLRSSSDESVTIPPSSGPRRSSPVIGSKAERALKRIQKGRVKRKATMEKQKEERQAEQTRRKAEQREERQAEQARRKAEQRQEENTRRNVVLDEVLLTLRTNDLQFWDLMEYVFNPANGQGNIRYNEFFARKSNAPKVLDWWMSANNRGRRAKAELREWILNYATRTISQEAETVTKSKELQTMGQTIDDQVIKRFDLEEIHNKLQAHLAPFSMCLIQAFAMAKGVKQHSEHRKEKTKMVCLIIESIIILILSPSDSPGYYIGCSALPRRIQSFK